jgi:hypothetical protein
VKLSVGIAIAVAAAVTAAPAAARLDNATLTLVGRDPVVVRGVNFRPLERVTVTATAQGRTIDRHVRAGRLGAFTVGLELVVSRCNGVGIRAVRPSGAVISLKLPLPACMPERTGRYGP